MITMPIGWFVFLVFSAAALGVICTRASCKPETFERDYIIYLVVVLSVAALCSVLTV